MADLIDRQAAIDTLMKEWKAYKDYPYVSHVRHGLEIAIAILENKVPSAQPDMAENLYPYKCYITDQDGLQHEVIHTGDIRRVTGWTI